ncbi:DUF748 domain-containing protein [Propionivibrio limicola]|uniref:DUF748 domain-containing protein n=1 Tax=Propionivibrio limicola TaxID=167645 RepID=UPI001478B3BD|nr:DUF748 domain-containing protein [Propionivibrio limicola]
MIDSKKMATLIQSPRTRKYGVRFLIAVVTVGILGFFVLPPIVKSLLLDTLGEVLHRNVSVEKIRINPYALSVTVDGVSIGERDGGGSFAGFDSLYLNVEASSLLRGGPVINEIRLVNPALKLVRHPDGSYNFSDLLDEFMARPKNDDPTPSFSLNNIQLQGGRVEFDDQTVGEKHVASDINLSIPFVSSMAYAADIFVEPAFSANFNGAPLAIKGRSKPFAQSLESEIDLDLTDLELAKYLGYAPLRLPIKVVSGTLDTGLKITFRLEADNQPSVLLSGTSALKDIEIDDEGGSPLVSMKRLDLAVESADLVAGKFVIDNILVDSPEVSAHVDKRGAINWLALLPRQNGANSPPSEKKAGNGKEAIEWSIGHAKISGGALRWLDESHGAPFKASIDAIEFGAQKLSSPNKENKEKAGFDLSWRVAAGEWLKIDQFTVKGGQLDLARHEIVLGDVNVNGGSGLIRRLADGRIDWIKPPALRVAEAARKDTSAPWKITVKRYVGDKIGLRFEDKAVSPAALQTINGLSFEVLDLSTDPAQTAKVKTRFNLNKRGVLAFDGTVKPAPLEARLNVDAKTIELLPLQPYFSEKLNIDVTQGLVTLKGGVQLRQSQAKSESAPSFQSAFNGDVTIGDFYSVDKLNSADFLRWKSFHLGNVDVRMNPDSVSIGEVALSDFFARVIVSPEGKLNLMQIVRQPEQKVREAGKAPSSVSDPSGPGSVANQAAEGKAAVPLETSKGPATPVKIGKITLQGGSVRFTDNFVKPNYTANLRKVGGRVSGLSSEPGTVANLDLRGAYDNVAPLTITAKINPLLAKPYLDLQAEVKGIEMTSFSTYSGKYAGYAIEKGKLSLFVKYKIENDQLEAENRVFLDQLTFGEPVDSPEATKLPVTLAVALLKNRNGEIDVNLPISGSLNDPEFSVGGLIVRVFVNLIAKAVTSPFALLGSVFGGGEELSNIEFAYGRAAITPEAEKRLENLAKALIDRPSLKLEIEGRIDPENDREGLKRARIDRLVRAAKREDMTKKGIETGGTSGIDVTPQEYPSLLERVYRSEKFPKPRNMIGMVKRLPVEEMEKLMLANTTIDEDDLLRLGDRRAKAVRDWFLAHEVPAERVFLRPSRLEAPEAAVGEESKGKASRADFSLK